MSLYYVNVTVHVLAAMFWLGGMFFLAAVGAPVLRSVQPPELRTELFRRLGEQFRLVGWIAIAILIVTGFLNLQLRGMLRGDVLLSGAFWTTPYGMSLGWKLGAVTGMLVLQAIHDFSVGPAASRLAPGSADMVRVRRHAALLARASAVLGLVVVIAAVRLARGG
jgi:copper resistance protein D